MELSTFDKLEVELFADLKVCSLGGNNLGEQLMAKVWDTALSRMQTFPFRLSLQTNGTLLTQHRIGMLIGAGCTINLSLEGASEDTYGPIRSQPFEKLVGVARALCEERDRRPDAGAQVGFSFTVFHHNLPDLPRLVGLASRLGIDRVRVTHLIPVEERWRYQSLLYHQSSANQIFTEASQLARHLGVALGVPEHFVSYGIASAGKWLPPQRLQAKEQPCYHPWTSVSIDERGRVRPCCVSSVVMGDLNKTSFERIWNGARYRRLRKTVNSSRPWTDCRACMLRGVDPLELMIGNVRLTSDADVLLANIGPEPGIALQPFLLGKLRDRLAQSSLGRILLPLALHNWRRFGQ